MFKKFWSYIEGINGAFLILYSVFIFSASVIINHHLSKCYFIISEIIIIILSIAICPEIIRLLSKVNISQQIHQRINGKIGYCVILRLLFILIPFFILLVYYIAFYPGGFSPDSVNQYTQVIQNQYNDWHPVIHTLVAFKIPLIISGGWIGSIVLFQMICFSLVIGYSLKVIYEYTNLKYAILSMLFISLNPLFGYMTMFPWKDISFAIGTLLLITYSVRIYFTEGNWIQSPMNMVLFIVTASFTTLCRHNALLFTIPLLIAILFHTTKKTVKKQGLIICLSVIVLCFGIRVPLYSVIGVEKPDKRKIETLGFPMTIIGAVVRYTPDLLDDETTEFAYKVAPREVWDERYSMGSYNYVKMDRRTNNDVIEEYGSQKVLSMMMHCFKNSPKIALIALIKLTEASYSLYDLGYSLPIPWIGINDVGLAQTGNTRIQVLLEDYRHAATDAFPHLFIYLGFMQLLLIVSIAAKCKLNSLDDWKKLLFILPLFSYNWGTSLLLTGVDDSIRFFYYTFPLVPALLVFLFANINNERGTGENVQLSK